MVVKLLHLTLCPGSNQCGGGRTGEKTNSRGYLWCYLAHYGRSLRQHLLFTCPAASESSAEASLPQMPLRCPPRQDVSQPPSSPAATHRPGSTARCQVRMETTPALTRGVFSLHPTSTSLFHDWGVKNKQARQAKHMQYTNSLPARWSTLLLTALSVNVWARCYFERCFCHLSPQETQSSATLPHGQGGRRPRSGQRGSPGPARGLGLPFAAGRGGSPRPLPAFAPGRGGGRAGGLPRGRRWQAATVNGHGSASHPPPLPARAPPQPPPGAAVGVASRSPAAAGPALPGSGEGEEGGS